MFISFEGIDGSGKTTQARRATEHLRKRGHTVVTVREPGGTILGEQIRELLLDPQGDVSARAELLMFSAARAHLVERVIRPALETGAIVIADRYIDSTTAYQGYGRGVLNVAEASAFHTLVTAGLEPDLTVLVDVDVETAQRRRAEALDDRIESASRAFHERVQDGYRELATLWPDRIHTVDGRLSEDILSVRIATRIESCLSRKKPR